MRGHICVRDGGADREVTKTCTHVLNGKRQMLGICST